MELKKMTKEQARKIKEYKPIKKGFINYYTCYECGYEWCSNNNDEKLCPRCGSGNIDYLGEKK